MNKNYHFPILVSALVVLIMIFLRSQIEVKKKIYAQNLSQCKLLGQEISDSLQRCVEQEAALASYQECLRKCNRIKSKQPKWSQILYAMSHNVPRSIWFENLYIEQSNHGIQLVTTTSDKKYYLPNTSYNYILTGKTNQLESMKQLNQTWEGSVQLNYADKQQFEQDTFVWQFQLSGTLN